MSNRPYVWTGGEETDKYDDIIDLPNYVSTRRPHASMLDRAAQFSPFDALEGYSDEISETARTTDERIELSEMQLEDLNEKINQLQELCAQAAHGKFTGADIALPRVTVTYFVPDKESNRHSQKTGGAYVSYTGTVRRVDLTMGTITFLGASSNRHKTLAIADIIEIDGDDLQSRGKL